MKQLFLLLFIPLFISLAWAQTGEQKDEEEQQLQKQIKEWYGQIGLEGKVSPDEFEAVIRGYFYYKKNGDIPNKNVIAIVNYMTPSTEKRFFIFQIGENAKMLREEWVAHGTGSGPPGGVVEKFSNEHQSHASSRGFYKTSETYYGKYGYSLRLDGFEHGINDQVRPRAVVIHGSRYIGDGRGGRSWGCLALAMSRKDPVIELLKNGVLIYGSDGQSYSDYPFSGGAGGKVSSQEIGSVPSENNDPGEETSSSYVAFEDVKEFQDSGTTTGKITHEGSDFNALGTPNAIPAISSMSSFSEKDDNDIENSFSEDMTNPGAKTGSAPQHGSAEFEECQNRASAPWEIVIAEASKPDGNPAKYFKATYNQLDSDVQNMDQTPDSVIKNMAISNHAKNERCIALARMMKNSHLSKQDKNTPETYETQDGSIKCKYESAESQDYVKCKELVDAYEESLVAEESMKEQQQKDFKKEGNKQLSNLKNSPNIQSSAKNAQQNLTSSQASIANERTQFHMAKLENLDRIQSAMPNRNSLLKDCRSYMNGKNHGLDHLKAYVNYLEVKDKSVPSTIDPCYAVTKVMNTNLIQNIPARKQAIKVLERVGLKIVDLNEKERKLLNQNLIGNKSRIGSSSALPINLGKLKDGDFKRDNKKFGLNKSQTSYSQGCVGDCKYSGGDGLRNGSMNKTSKDNNSMSNFSGYGYMKEKSATNKNETLVFEPPKDPNDIYSGDFYKNVSLAMSGQIPLKNLTPAERKEYFSQKEYQNRSVGSSPSDRSTNKHKGINEKNALNKEIWFNSDMDLFKIISRRYIKVFNK